MATFNSSKATPPASSDSICRWLMYYHSHDNQEGGGAQMVKNQPILVDGVYISSAMMVVIPGTHSVPHQTESPKTHNWTDVKHITQKWLLSVIDASLTQRISVRWWWMRVHWPFARTNNKSTAPPNQKEALPILVTVRHRFFITYVLSFEVLSLPKGLQMKVHQINGGYMIYV